MQAIARARELRRYQCYLEAECTFELTRRYSIGRRFMILGAAQVASELVELS